MGSLPVGISGSRAAAIIGLSQYSTPFTVWQEIMEKLKPGFNKKQGYLYEPFEGNPATEFGLAFESAVIKLTEDATGGDTITHREAAYSLDGQDYVTCHIDGKLDNFTKLFEGKTTNHRAFGFSWGEPGTDRVPTTVQCQAQHNMMCAGLDSAHISVLVFPATVDEWAELGWKTHYDTLNGVHFLKNHNTDKIITPIEWAKTLQQMGFFHTYNIEAKPDTQKILKELYKEFWNKYVLEEVAPEATCYPDIMIMFTSPKGKLVIDEKDKIGGEPVADIMREYKAITQEVGSSGHLAKRKAFIKVQVLKFAREKTTVEDDESAERVLFLDESGHKLGSFNKKGFRS